MARNTTHNQIYGLSEALRKIAHEGSVVNRMISDARRAFKDIPQALSELEALDEEATEGLRRKALEAVNNA